MSIVMINCTLLNQYALHNAKQGYLQEIGNSSFMGWLQTIKK